MSASGDKDLGLGVVILYKRRSGGERHSLGFLRNRMAVTTSFHPVCWGLVYSLATADHLQSDDQLSCSKSIHACREAHHVFLNTPKARQVLT